MYKDKEKQKQANKEAAQRRRDKAKGMTRGVTNIIPEQKGVTDYQAHVGGVIGEALGYLSALPDDTVIACNQDIGWPEILAMDKRQIDYVYECWKAVGDNILLRLRRAAGYHVRTA